MTKHTRAKWTERIREWRASGLSAEEFAAGKDYEPSSLRWAASQLGAEKTAPPTPALAPIPPPTPAKAPRRRRPAESSVAHPSGAPRFVPVRMRRAKPLGGELIVEVGGARIRVTRGTDVALLGDVVRALQGVAR